MSVLRWFSYLLGTIMCFYGMLIIKSIYYIQFHLKHEIGPNGSPHVAAVDSRVEGAQSKQINFNNYTDVPKHNQMQWIQQMDERMLERKGLLQDMCINRYNRHLVKTTEIAETPRRLRALIVNDRIKFVYSIVYKVGSKNWQRIIVELAGFQNVPAEIIYRHHALAWMPKFTTLQIIERLVYPKFLFVRNPFSRIVSAYKDKFVDHHNNAFNNIGKRIIKKHRKTWFNVSQIDGTDVTFPEFVEHLLNGHHTSNVHWRPIHIQNYPCEIYFDYIGKLEESNEDAKYILTKLGIWDEAHYLPVHFNPETDEQRLKTYYSTLSKQSVKALYQLYEPDFTLFGYELSDFFQSMIN